jgi:hypothetical protein
MDSNKLRHSVVIFITLFSFFYSHGQTLDKHFFSTNGDVYTLKKTDSFLYVGGLFNYIGRNAGGLALFAEDDDQAFSGLPNLGFNPNINAACSDQMGGWYVAGYYTHANNIPQVGITHILQDNSVDRRFKPPILNFTKFNQILLDGNFLYLAGNFTYEYGSNTYKNLIRVNAETGTFDEHWRPNPSGEIYDVEIIGDLVFATGTFVHIGEYFQKNIAAVSKTSGLYVTSFGSSELPNFMVKKNDTLFFGKDAHTISGIQAYNNALISTHKKHLILKAFPTEEQVFKSIADGNGGWYVLGNFTNLDNVFTQNIGHIYHDLKPNPSFVQSKDIGLQGTDYDMCYHHNKLYIAGDFSFRYNGKTYQHLIRLHSNTGELDTLFNPIPDSAVFALCVKNNVLYFGGKFSHINGQSRNNIAAINLLTDDLDSWNAGSDGNIYSITTTNTGFFVGGDFTNINNQNRNALAAFSNSGVIQNIPISLPPASCIKELISNDSFVYFGGDFCFSNGGKIYCNIASYNFRLFKTGDLQIADISLNGEKEWHFELSYDTLFIAGNFDSVQHQKRPFFVAVNRHTGTAFPWSLNPDNKVSNISLSGHKLLISGQFNYLQHIQSPIAYVATNSMKLHSVDVELKSGYFNDIAFYKDNLIAGGNFKTVNDSAISNLASLKLNGQLSNWKIVETETEITQILEAARSLFVVGKTNLRFGNIQRSFVAAVNFTDGQVNDWNAGFSAMPKTIKYSDKKLFFTGNFNFVNGQSCSNLARINLNTQQIDKWAPAVNGRIYDIENLHDTILIGGLFTFVNEKVRTMFCALSAHADTLIPGVSINLNKSVFKILVDKNYVHVGGEFTAINNVNRPGLLSLPRSSLTFQSWPYSQLKALNPKIHALALFENELIVNGPISLSDNIDYSILSFDIQTGVCTNKIKQSDVKIDHESVDFEVFDSCLFVGSIFDDNQQNLHKIDLKTFTRTNCNTQTDFAIRNLELHDSSIWVMGDFVKNKGYARLEVISPRLDSSILKKDLPMAYGTFQDIVVDSDDLYLAGDFLEIEGQPNSRLANYSGGANLLKPGIHNLTPSKSANYNLIKFYIHGLGFQAGSSVRFKKGLTTLYPDSLIVEANTITGVLVLNNVDTGYYDVYVYFPSGNFLALRNALFIETAEKPDFWIDLLGPEIVLAKEPYNYLLSYGNRSNAGYLGIPLAMAIPDTVIFNFGNEYLQLVDSSGVLDSIKVFVISDTLVKEYLPNSAVYGFMIPYLEPKGAGKINLTLNVPIGDWHIAYCMGQPIYDFNNSRSEDFVISQTARDFIYELSQQTSLHTNVQTIEKEANSLSEEINGFLLKHDYPAAAPVLPMSAYFGKLLHACDEETIMKSDPGIMMSYFFNGGGKDTSKTKYIQGYILKVKKITGVYAHDPNLKHGPSDYYVKGNETFRYLITFENDKDATAPAKMVRVIDQIDTNVFDANSIQVISYGYGENYYSVQPGIKEYQLNSAIDFDTTVFLQHSLTIEKDIFNWYYNTIDEFSLLPTENALSGFLPPNKNAPEGEGYVLFTLKLKENLPSGTIIRNKADIYFDYNDKIETPVWENQIDTDFPLSKVDTLAHETHATEFYIRWSGHDSVSGIQYYNIYVSENNGGYYPWLLFSKDTFALFSGQKGNTYRFYSIAVDQAFNEEEAPADYDAIVSILAGIEEKPIEAIQSLLYQNSPNPVSGRTEISYYLQQDEHIQLLLNDAQGRKIKIIDSGLKNKGKHHISFDTNTLEEGVYFYSLILPNAIQTKRMLILK